MPNMNSEPGKADDWQKRNLDEMPVTVIQTTMRV